MSLDTQQPATATVPLAQGRPPVNPRSTLLGLLGVTLIAALTPFNNLVLNNTDLVSNFLPIGVLLFLMLFVILINAPLSRFAPRYAFSAGELAVVLGMMLVGCALPYVGLMRYLPGHLTGLFYFASQRPEYADFLRKANLPDWLFPAYSAADIAARGNDPIVRDYVGRAVVDSDTFAAHVAAVPWRAWLQPAISWGIFFAGLFGSVICMMVVFRRQWVENERLQFPLAAVYMSLIEPPAPGKALNSLFRNPVFWMAFGAVAFIHLFNGLGAYFPRLIPAIPLSFNLSSILTEEPWRYIEWDVKFQRIYFTIIGITMFMQTRTAFSLWAIFMLVQVARMAAGMRQSEVSEQMTFDQLFGAVIVFGGIILYVARHHLFAVLRQMVGPGRPDDPRGRYLPYRLAGWGFVACQFLLIGWLMAAGATLIGAIVIVGMLMLLYLCLARIVADTGMIYPLLPVPVAHPFNVAGTAIAGSPRTGATSYFFASLFSGILTHDLRQASPPYVQHAMAVADRAAYGRTNQWGKAIGFVGVLVLALAISYLVSGASMLYSEYAYAATLDRSNTAPIGWWGNQGMVQNVVMDPAVRYDTSGGQTVPHNRFLHIGTGAAITAALGALRLNFASWPLHPVGFLLCYTWGLRQIWFSIFLGWLAKTLIVHFGGAKMFSQAQPFFLGLIYGEVMAAAFWLVTSLVLWMVGLEYRAIALLPV